ncbi:LOW QUALITY PROTEIN: deleted in malignant brain tumors 1 protein-like [Pogoniulus pusillus]|uniref:LOW QUALITY PROTEIN: deleted in malignant brain tumors 1 protein-like n=1 Tax=Pogoniulus pusillus TaxID=488313 RepID=UPI0030B93F4F
MGTEAPVSSTRAQCRVLQLGTESKGQELRPGGSVPAAASLRLVGTGGRCAGRLELAVGGQWGTVCDDLWGLPDAEVVCRQLRCGPALAAPPGAFFGEGRGRIWLDDVRCQGNESSLLQCPAAPLGTANCQHREDAAVVCAGTRGAAELRLADGPGRCAGRVEVLHDQRWGTICDDDWSFPEAAVVCRQLGCGAALSAHGGAHFGPGSGPIWLDNVECSGSEAALSQCPARPWGDNNCGHGEDASVVCTGKLCPSSDYSLQYPCQDSPLQYPSRTPPCKGTPAGTAASAPGLQLRLEGGRGRCAGRLEVLRYQQWGTVCDPGWSLAEAAVVCRQLGCGTALAASGTAAHGQGSGRIWLDDVNCTGTEQSLAQCQSRTWRASSCGHREDVWVECSATGASGHHSLRLANGSNSCVGRVEVLHAQQWGTVCDDNWDLQDASVVCRQLGCGTALAAPGSARFGHGPDPVWLDDVHCLGTESALSQCQLREWGEHNCGHEEDAGAICSGAAAQSPSGSLRLVGGPDRCAGRLEVLHNGSWGTVCDDSWGPAEGRVVCRQLGCGALLSVAPGGRYGEGTGQIWLDEVNCTGKEEKLSECHSRPWGEHNCQHLEDASVECSDSSISKLGNLRLLGGPDRCAGRVEVLHEHMWGTVCDDAWDLEDAAVVCRQLGCGTALWALSGAYFGRGHDPIWLDEVECTGAEESLFSCTARAWGHNNCVHGEDAGVVCSASGVSLIPELRLANGSRRCQGRVEVTQQGTWAPLCDHGWGLAEARVVCRQLGCGRALEAPGKAQFGSGAAKMWPESFSCVGTEGTIGECKRKALAEGTCPGGRGAAVVCAAPPEGAPVRLVGSGRPCAGRVEILHGREWGTVCDSSWDLRDAAALCRQLDCGWALAAPRRAPFGQGSGIIWLDQVDCKGTEQVLSSCPARPWGITNCSHAQDAGVVCSGVPEPAQLRLANGSQRCAGRVEVLHRQRWGAVCARGWDAQDAEVVCRQLGCGRALPLPEAVDFGPGPSLVWLDNVSCQGTESALQRCWASPWEETNCSQGQVASVVCSGSDASLLAPVRLAAGPGPCAGRVELLHGAAWRTVCDAHWDMLAAQVLCRQLGCGAAVAAPGQAHYGQGQGPVWPQRVQCNGSEAALSQCGAGPREEHNCSHRQDVSVVCAGSGIADLGSLRAVNGSGGCSGRLQVLHEGRWGGICADGWGQEEAQVACRQLGCGEPEGPKAAAAALGAAAEPLWVEAVECSGSEGALFECRVKLWGAASCKSKEQAAVSCAELSGPELGSPRALRLAQGPHRCAGRVEVLHRQQWGTVCGRGWSLREAAVLCRQLSCGAAASAPGSAAFGPGAGPVWLAGLSCLGTEATLAECQAKPRGQHPCEHLEDASVVCTGSGPAGRSQLRLQGGLDECSGRVEIFYSNQWGTICDDSWDLNAAAVVCRQLGCGLALSAPLAARFGMGEGPIWLDDVSCTGEESDLLACRAKTWSIHNCNHAEDAGVVCAGNSSSATLRLAGGPHECAGRVEVAHEGQWGTVCDDSWDLADARVVCRQLGCGGAEAAPGQARFGQGSGHIWLDDVGCTGAEQHLGQCPARPWGHSNCQHREDASVICSGGSGVRLAQGPHRCAGRVEVLRGQQWGSVCDDRWDLRDAAVVCRQLRCGAALAAPGGAAFGPGTDPIWLDRVSCTGAESALQECPALPWGQHHCSHQEDASVVCSGEPRPGARRCQSCAWRGGPHECAGRVEVAHEGQWGTVCDDSWDLADARVVCRQLGCGGAEAAPGQARFGQGSGHIWLDDVGCTGAEQHLGQCPARPWGHSNCQHREDASVICSGGSCPGTVQLRLAEGPSRCAGRVEVLHGHQWGTVCDDSWDLKDAKVVCRQLGCGTAVATPGRAHFGQGSDPIWLDEVECSGLELSLAHCGHRGWGQHNCQHEEDAAVICSGTEPWELRLQGGSGACQGLLQVLHGGSWHRVCSIGWSLLEAEVVCRQLGCGPALSAPAAAPAGGHSLLKGLSCLGTESLLLECQQKGAGLAPCSQGHAAGVVCTRPRGAAAPCWLLSALLALLMLLSGLLLWLTLRRSCLAAAPAAGHRQGRDQAAAASSLQPLGAIYSPSRGEAPEDSDSEGTQLMGEEVGSVLEELVAEAALVRPLLAVHAAVLQQQRGPGEGLAAGLAAVGPLARVRPLVDRQVNLLPQTPQAWGLSWQCWRRCSSRAPAAAKSLPQSGHLKGRSAQWVRPWRCSSLEERLKRFPHSSQRKGLSSVCTRPWLLKSEWRLKEAWHSWQRKGRSSLCTTSWLNSSQALLKAFSQLGHWKGFSSTITSRISSSPTPPPQWPGGPLPGPGSASAASHGKVLAPQGSPQPLETQEPSWPWASGTSAASSGMDQAPPVPGGMEKSPHPPHPSGRPCLHLEWAETPACGSTGPSVAEELGQGRSAPPGPCPVPPRPLRSPRAVSGTPQAAPLPPGRVRYPPGRSAPPRAVSGTPQAAPLPPGRVRYPPGRSAPPGPCPVPPRPLRSPRAVSGTPQAAPLPPGRVRYPPGRSAPPGPCPVPPRPLRSPRAVSGTPQAAPLPPGRFRCRCSNSSPWSHFRARALRRDVTDGRREEAEPIPWELLPAACCCLLLPAAACCLPCSLPRTFAASMRLVLLGCLWASLVAVLLAADEDGAPLQVRLAGGAGACAGRVEVLHEGTWGTVCHQHWDLREARVVCRQLGCGPALAAPREAKHGEGKGRIWLSDLRCKGTEASLGECQARPWGDNLCNHAEDASVECSGAESPEPGPIRLVGGPNRCAGRVEVLHEEQWGTVCHDEWDLSDAQVVCRQLGCGDALLAPRAAKFGPGFDAIWLDDVNCTGTEAALWDCQARPWGHHNCYHGEDASAVCSESGIAVSSSVRLVDGPRHCAGRVEVLHEGAWGTVCDDHWDLREARVVCRQLGCGPALAAPREARYKEGKGRIWLSDLNCTGDEASLGECQAQPWGDNLCNHAEDASVECSEAELPEQGPVRLAAGPNRCAGRVEVLHQQRWGSVCDDLWDMQDARVVCRQLGCGAPLSALGNARYGRGPDLIWLDDVECQGTEQSLTECQARPWGEHNCYHGEDADVVCAGGQLPEPGPVRLANSGERCAGRVEVKHEGQWGTVCGFSWDFRDAAVVCRQLGCGSVLEAHFIAHFGPGSGPIWMSHVDCAGTESALSDCRHRGWGQNECLHFWDVGARCSVTRMYDPRSALWSC